MKTVAVSILLVLVASTEAIRAGDEADPNELTYHGRKLSSLLADLKNPNAKVRKEAVSSISWLGQDARKQALPALAGLLQDSDASVREELISTISAIGGRHPVAIAALQQALNDREPKLRINAAYALADKGIDKKDNVAILLLALKDQNFAGRWWAAWYLSRIEPDPVQVLPGLVDGLRDKNLSVRSECAKALGTLHTNGRDAASALRAALDDEDEYVRIAAAVALWQTSGEKERSVAVLVKLLGYNPDGNMSFDSLWQKALTTDHDTFSQIALTHYHTLNVREEAARALGNMGAAAHTAVPALLLSAVRKVMHAPHWVFQAKHVRFSCITFLTCDKHTHRRVPISHGRRPGRLRPDSGAAVGRVA